MRWFYIPAFLLVLQSCSGGRMLVLRNNSPDTAYISWKIVEDSVAYTTVNITNSDTMTYIIPPGGKATQVKITTGQGAWSKKELKEFLDNFELIRIRSGGGDTVLTSLEEMMIYFLPLRKNLGKGRLDLVVR